MHPCCLNQIVGQAVIMGRNSLTISGRFLGLPSSYKRTQNPWRVCAGPRNWQHPFTEFKSVRLCQRRGKPGSGKENLLTVLVEADCSSLRQLTYYQILCMLTMLTLLLAQEERKKKSISFNMAVECRLTWGRLFSCRLAFCHCLHFFYEV